MNEPCARDGHGESRREPESARVDARREPRKAEHAEPRGDAHRAFRHESREDGEDDPAGRPLASPRCTLAATGVVHVHASWCTARSHLPGSNNCGAILIARRPRDTTRASMHALTRLALLARRAFLAKQAPFGTMPCAVCAKRAAQGCGYAALGKLPTPSGKGRAAHRANRDSF